MLGLVLILLMLAVGVAAVLSAGALVIQGYLYSEPAEGLTWRGAVAGAVMGLFFGLWCWLEVRSPGQFDTLFNFDPSQTIRFDKFWAERVGDRGKQEVPYRRGRNERGGIVYTDPEGKAWRRTDNNGRAMAIVVEEDGERKRFAAETNPDGSFKVESGEPVRYVEVEGRGRVMTDAAPGEITSTRTGLLLGNLLLNLAHFLAWFLCIWLLLRFQWTHALGLAAVFWLAFALMVWPLLQAQVRKSMSAAPAASASAQGFTCTRNRMPWSPNSGSDCIWA
jgi:hypothetical protein